MYLFPADRAKDTGLRCALGTRVRDCPILAAIKAKMEAARAAENYPSAAEDHDVDAAMVWTCVGHILSSGARVTDGAFFWRKGDEYV